MNIKNLLRNGLVSSKGYTLDQTILIIAIIAILITLIILTVGWSLINKASGTRLASQLGNVQDAIGNYYGDNKAWPIGSTSNPINDIQALAGANSANGINTKNYLGGLTLISGTGVFHNLNASPQANRRVTLYQLANGWNGPSSTHEVVEFQSVYGSDFLDADKAIDSSDGGATGNIRAIANSASAPTTTTGCYAAAPTFIAAPAGTVLYDVCYIANNVQ